ncbi:hypothetical protein J6590_063011 [Homalodisca vitripennis]|nr:hypothetical protein J6590_063011 [Homalodisca vitripennis]
MVILVPALIHPLRGRLVLGFQACSGILEERVICTEIRHWHLGRNKFREEPLRKQRGNVNLDGSYDTQTNENEKEGFEAQDKTTLPERQTQLAPKRGPLPDHVYSYDTFVYSANEYEEVGHRDKRRHYFAKRARL